MRASLLVLTVLSVRAAAAIRLNEGAGAGVHAHGTAGLDLDTAATLPSFEEFVASFGAPPAAPRGCPASSQALRGGAASRCCALCAAVQPCTFCKFWVLPGRTYANDEETLRRRIIVDGRLAEIRIHNANPAATWRMARPLGLFHAPPLRFRGSHTAPHTHHQGVNDFLDRTEQELSALRGVPKRLLAAPQAVGSTAPAPLPPAPTAQQLAALPAAFDWRSLGVVTPVKSQGSCGSCWAFAAAETLESAHALATGSLLTVSEQMILDCTPNPLQCGGSGGCSGATPELAFGTVQTLGGAPSEESYPYTSGGGGGNKSACRYDPQAAGVSVLGYVKLPANEEGRVMHALATVGPLAVNVDASRFALYAGGVFDGCSAASDVDIDHAVQLVGWGADEATGLDYWLVRNSWSAAWGEEGYMRLRRTPGPPACKPDRTPADGSDCEGVPSPVQEVTVCGDCGVLYDVSYPLVQRAAPAGGVSSTSSDDKTDIR